MSDIAYIEDSDPVQSTVTLGKSSGTGSQEVGKTTTARKKSTPSDTKVEGAVYAYIRAVRALGRTRTNTADIALALGLSRKTVERTIVRLNEKGVKVAG